MPATTTGREGKETVLEEQRIAALKRYDILDTPPDGTFDDITHLVSTLLKVPIAIVSLVDTDRIWFKSHHGLEVTEIERGPGLCSSAIMQDVAHILPDATRDPVALVNPLVAGAFGLRYYVGEPLRTHDGYNLGTLCAIDFEPRTPSAQDLEVLKTLARVVMDQMELRRAARHIESLNKELSHANFKVGLAIDAGTVGMYEMSKADGNFLWNEAMSRIYGLDEPPYNISVDQWLKLIHPGDSSRVAREWKVASSTRKPFLSQYRIRQKSGDIRHICSHAKFVDDVDTVEAVGVNIDITEQYRALSAQLNRTSNFAASRKKTV
jgi:PAS domain-containing protein